MQAFDPRVQIPETLIDAFVDRIVFDKGVFSWYLNPKLGNETFKVGTSDFKKSMLKVQKTLLANSSTGCDCPEVSECYLFSVKLDFEKAKSSHYLQKCR